MTHTDGSTFVLRNEVPIAAVLFRDTDVLQLGNQTLCREERSSDYGLFVAMAVEIDLIKKLKPGEAPPKGWTPSLNAPWENCTARTSPDYQALSEELRTTTLPNLRKTLATVQKQLRAKNWAGASASSVPLADLAAEVARRSTRDYPEGGSTVWSAMRNLAWEAERASGEIAVRRLAALGTTSDLVDSLLADIDHIDTSKPLW